MKTLARLFVLISYLSWSSYASSEFSPQIQVSGNAEKQIVPDTMKWTLHVKNQAKELPTTAEQHTQIVKQVVSFLKSNGIEKKKIQTSNMTFGENWEYLSNQRNPSKTGYVASTHISFDSVEISTYEKLWLGLSNFDKVSVQNISYDHSKRVKIQNEVRTKALLKARQKAIHMAETLDAKIGIPLKIVDEPSMQSSPFPVNYRAQALEGASSENALSPGTISIQGRVQVTFKLIN